MDGRKSTLGIVAKEIEVKMFNNIYKGKKVLVTGHTGFKGSWLTLWLNKLGAKVCGYSLEPNTEPSMFKELNLVDVC